MKYLFLAICIICAVPKYRAQYKPYYTFAAGLRAGSTASTCGLTLKGFIANNSALEAIVGYYKNGISGTLLFEQHTTLFRREEFQFYYGGGVHYNNSTEYQNWIIIEGRVRSYEQVRNSYGFDAVFGIEYKLLNLPLAFSLDLKPAIELNKVKSFSLGVDQGLAIKLAF